MIVLFYNFHQGAGWAQYGVRYYYSGFSSLVVLAVAAFKNLFDWLGNKRRILYVLSFVLCVHVLFSFFAIREYSDRFKIKLAINSDIRKECPDESIVILDPERGYEIDKSNCLRMHQAQ